jgi:peptidoglycan-associated lipoprotein
LRRRREHVLLASGHYRDKLVTYRNLTTCVGLALALSLAACATKPKTLAQAPPILSAEPQTDGGPQSGTPEVGAAGLQGQFAAEAGERIYFAVDSHQLGVEAAAALARQADWLNAHPRVRALLAGNCDERGTREYNLALGARRAAAARDHLVRQGIDARRLDTVSYGKERPLDAGSGETAWSRNRNAYTRLTDPGAAAPAGW